MTPHRFTFTLLCCVLLGTISNTWMTMDAVQADPYSVVPYSHEDDLDWLLKSTPDPSILSVDQEASEPSAIIQTGLLVPSKSRLTPHVSRTGIAGPCDPVFQSKPAGASKQVLPPEPETLNTLSGAGLISDNKTGVENMNRTTPADAEYAESIVQLSSMRLPPPKDAPKEQYSITRPSDFHAAPVMPQKISEPKIPPSKIPPSEISEPKISKPEKEIKTNEDVPSLSAPASLPVKEQPLRFNWYPAPHKNSYQNDQGYCHQCDRLGCDSSCSESSETSYNSVSRSAFVPSMVGGSAWFAGHHLGEQFNASVQSRLWADFRHGSHVITRNEERWGVEQFSFGMEKQLNGSRSVELRVPLTYQFTSDYSAGNASSMELGNVSILAKQIVHENTRWTISGGGGISMPASRWNHKTYTLLPFLGVQWHPHEDTFGHAVVQADVSLGSSASIFNRNIVHSGIQLGHWFYRGDRNGFLSRFGGFVEMNYSVVTKGVPLDIDSGAVFSADSLRTGKSSFSATLGIPMVFGKLSATHSLTLPIQNDTRPYTLGYQFSLNRQF